MDESEVRNLLYRRPELYEQVYPEPGEATPKMCRRMFERFLGGMPASILDIGCGTGRDLGTLVRDGAEGWGVDRSPEMLSYARTQRPELHLTEGDMRVFRLGRTFDAILCMGSVLMYALTDEDVRAVLATFSTHAHEGTLLILDINNAASLLPGGLYKTTMETSVDAPGFKARAVARHEFDRRNQLIIRRRTWEIEGGGTVEDFCRYRLFFPVELEHLLRDAGFEVAGMFDNKRLTESDLTGLRLYVAAVKQSGKA